jgi:hypothetical protein
MAEQQALTPQQIALSTNFQRVFQQQQQQQQQQKPHQRQQSQQHFNAGAQMILHNPDSNSDQSPSFPSQESQLLQLYQNFNQPPQPSNPQVVTSSSSFATHSYGGEEQSKAMMDQYRNLFGAVPPDTGNGVAGDRFMLQSKVESFKRDSNPMPASDDSDLWKVFDDDVSFRVRCICRARAGVSHMFFWYLHFGQHNPLSSSMHKTLNLSLKTYTFPSQNRQVGQHDLRQLQPSSVTGNPESNATLSGHESQLMWQPTPIDQNNPLADQDDFDTAPFILPSTMIPPSVLAFSSSEESKKRKASKNSPAHKSKRLKQIQPSITPQAFLEQLVAQRGHSYQRISSDDAEYDAVPSPLQLASFGTALVKATHTGDTGLLAQLLECGLSPNPCNQFRDSIVDLVCKRANESIFTCLLEHDCDLQSESWINDGIDYFTLPLTPLASICLLHIASLALVVDGFGRTPLHHACWASIFSAPIVEQILKCDPIQLCIEDKHGQTPLEYVRSELTGEWISFLDQNINKFFDPPPELQSPKQRRPEGCLMDPPNSIGVSLAALVSAGSISPAQIAQMDDQTRRTYKAKG